MDHISVREAIEYLLNKFRLERYVYLTVSLLSFLCLLVCGYKQLVSPEVNVAVVVGMFGSGGAIAFVSSQFLTMWRDCMNLFIKLIDKSQG